MSDWTTIEDLTHHVATLENCTEVELALLADHEIPGAETALSSRLAAQRILILKVEAKLAKELPKQAGMFK